MTERFYGGAFVVLPDEEGLRSSQAIVSGETKEDITITSHEKGVFNSIVELREQISNFTHTLVDLQGPGVKIPISCGVGNSINAVHVVEGLRDKNLRKVIGKKVKDHLSSLSLLDQERMSGMIGVPEIKKMEEEVGENFSTIDRISITSQATSLATESIRIEASQGALFNGIADIFQKGTLFSKRLKVDRRGYVTPDELDVLGLGKDMRLMLASYSLGIDLLNELFEMLIDEDLLKGEKEPTLEMKQKVAELAKRYAEVTQDQLVKRNIGGDYMNRFINISNENDLRNIVFVVPELRQIFSETFLKELHFKHNVCIKPTWAKPSPPFGDVVATFLADAMDKRDGTSPGAVGINHGEEYT